MLKENNYNCHVIFSHMFVNHDKITHLRAFAQAIWINEIMLFVLKSSCFFNILQHHLRSFANIVCKIFALKKNHSDDIKVSINVQYVMFKRFLHFFWIEIMKRCNHKREVEIFKHVKFHDSLLIISAHDLKLQIKWKIAIKTRVNFLQHLQLCFHWRVNYFSRQNY